jgi:hypothetical protein
MRIMGKMAADGKNVGPYRYEETKTGSVKDIQNFIVSRRLIFTEMEVSANA